jgi:acyl carrier protein phosphodiesterase
MNYLAHAYLAESSDEFLIGSFIGDFVKGSVGQSYSSEMTKGIRFHRQVDIFADAHHLSRVSRNLFSHQRRRYAGIILDICYDHFLSKHWSSYSDNELSGFINRVYALLEHHRRILPEKLQVVLPRMFKQNWLACYRTIEGVDMTLNRIAKRITRENSLSGSIGEIKNNYKELESNFFDFFPDLLKFAESFSESKNE